MTNCYIYRHIRLDTNTPFYIGMGSKEDGFYPSTEYERAYNTNDRTEFWHNIVNKAGGYVVEILLDDLSSFEACDKEREFISLYGREDKNTGILCNLTD